MKKWKKAASILAVVVLMVVSVAATQGSESNPLVTVSYLKNVFTPSVSTQTQNQITTAQNEYKKELDGKITAYTAEMEKLAGNQSGSAVFSTVEVAAGKTINLTGGCEIVLRVGQANLMGTELLDTTNGTVLTTGGGLVKNNLYMATGEKQAIKAINSVTVLVHGSYSLT